MLADAAVARYTDGIALLHPGFPVLLAVILIGLGWWHSRNRGETLARARS
jgi:hypothetical protein